MTVGLYGTVDVNRTRYAVITTYGDAALLVTVLYDYLTHLDQEVELIWNKRLTYISSLYYLMRYLGIVYIVFICLNRFPDSFHERPCESLYVGVLVCKTILAPVIQGFMAFRVYILYRPCRVLFVFLLALFIVAQGTATAGLAMLAHMSAGYQSIAAPYCSIPHGKTSDKGWLAALNVICPIVLEVILCILVLYRWFTRFRSSRRQVLPLTVDDILTTLVRDNIVYFVIAVICMFLSPRWALPMADDASFDTRAAWYNNITNASQVALFSLCGPRMILNVRKYYDQDNAVTKSCTTAVQSPRELTTVVLQDASRMRSDLELDEFSGAYSASLPGDGSEFNPTDRSGDQIEEV
ncbi:hypothetical protein CONPUDRAFT_80211 [Coniophora puteana RWD-64-598 SS2]|uniref:DUF6533 domain-containing protein n=1 Tax=Coniophora puteana (strain RWD-64-598) TaxID=741705 RepID=A0A5M3N3C7_CONPW|nr:uncharacterized protein CONPUDRAFT_80211 [Coniophora puteana RWD-64-598 SS2]EIW85797.1 hypothetical protein CONPUDRAFT_80211 [Coniophora puteana RWD-64-598 SS2]